jgi:type IV pilus assembly protein PilQ
MRWLGRGVMVVVLGAACAQIPQAQTPDDLFGPVDAVADRPADSALAPAADQDAQRIGVRDVHLEPDADGQRVVIALTRAPDRVRDFQLDSPPRLVLDLAGPPAKNRAGFRQFRLEGDGASAVRTAPRGHALRVVVDLAAGTHIRSVHQEGTTLLAALSPDAAAAQAAPAVANEPAADVASAGGEVVEGADPVSMVPPAPVEVAAASGVTASDAAPADRIAAPASDAGSADTATAPADAATAPADPPAVATVPPVPAPRAAGVEAPRGREVPEAAAPAPGRELAGSRIAAAEPEKVDGMLMTVAAAAADTPSDTNDVVAAPPPTYNATGSRAAALDPIKPPPVPQVLSAPDAGGYHGQRISLDLKDADILNVLRLLADVSGLNIIATEDVQGKITVHLTDVPWDQVLDLVLRANRLDKTQEGNVVRISTIERLTQEREAMRAAQQAAVEVEPLRVEYIRVNYARADAALVDKVKGVLTDRGSVTFDDRTNTIIVRDIPRGITEAVNLIRELDTQSPQVLIEANIVEATEDFARGLGVQWGYAYKAGPQTGNPTGSNFPGTIGLGGSGVGFGNPPPAGAANVPRLPVPFLADFPVPASFGSGFGAGNGSALDLALGSIDGTQTLSARLTALEEQGKGRVVSRPRVITMNNVAATIQSLTILRVKLPSTGTVINTGTGGVAGGASTATEKINTGITLVVTPQVSQDGYVLMSIYAKSSQPDFTRAVDGIPNEISREANSNVLIPNGETVVLGGIFRNTIADSENGIPYLNRIPGLGWIFKRVLRSDRREELLVFLTPRVVSNGNSERLPTAQRLWEGRGQGS